MKIFHQRFQIFCMNLVHNNRGTNVTYTIFHGNSFLAQNEPKVSKILFIFFLLNENDVLLFPILCVMLVIHMEPFKIFSLLHENTALTFSIFYIRVVYEKGKNVTSLTFSENCLFGSNWVIRIRNGDLLGSFTYYMKLHRYFLIFLHELVHHRHTDVTDVSLISPNNSDGKKFSLFDMKILQWV